MGRYLTNLRPEDAKRYQTAIFLTGIDLEVRHHHNPNPSEHYHPRNGVGLYSLYDPSGRGYLHEFWAVYDFLKTTEEADRRDAK